MKDDIEVILLYANKTEEDIVLREELDSHISNRIKVYYILDNPENNWPHLKGFVTHEILQSICPLDDPNTLYTHCGPGPMNKIVREIFSSHYP